MGELSELDFRDTMNTAVGKPLDAAVGTFSSNMPLPNKTAIYFQICLLQTKLLYIFNQQCHFKNLQDLECAKAVQH